MQVGQVTAGEFGLQGRPRSNNGPGTNVRTCWKGKRERRDGERLIPHAFFISEARYGKHGKEFPAAAQRCSVVGQEASSKLSTRVNSFSVPSEPRVV